MFPNFIAFQQLYNTTFQTCPIKDPVVSKAIINATSILLTLSQKTLHKCRTKFVPRSKCAMRAGVRRMASS
jgi:hypothetical protein